MTVTDTSANTEQLIEFSYDAVGQPLTMTLDGTVYYYLLNIQGDVMGLVDGSGNLLVSYLYEAYGECFYITDTSDMVNTLIGANPLLYRSYLIDTGTGLYYLQSRYYDPQLGRFLNADKYFSNVGGDMIGANMFAYCFNNPVNLDDIGGNWPNFVNKAASLFKSAVKAVATAVKKVKDNFQSNLEQVDITFSRGYTQSFSIAHVSVSVAPCISIDTKGNVEHQVTISGTLTTSSAPSAATCKTWTVTNAPTAAKLQGDSVSAGGSYFYPITQGLCVGGNVDVLAIPDYMNNKQYYGAALSGGISPMPGGEIHVGYGYTYPMGGFSFNVFDMFDSAYNSIMEW